jgi:glutamate dehydrogenase (NAD(P)+)
MRTLTSVVDTGGRPLGWLALNADARPRAVGGIRCTPDVSAPEISALADAMSWKFGWLGMPMGGAKAGLVATPEWDAEGRHEAMRELGRALGPQVRSGIYGAGSDIGTGLEDVWEFLRGAGKVSGPPPPPSQRGDTGEPTAMTVFACIMESLRATRGQVWGSTVAIEGLGSVGSALARMLHEAGVRVTAVSNRLAAVAREDGVDVPAILKSRAEAGDAGLERHEGGMRIEHAELLELDVDVLVPCARTWGLNAANVDRLRCRSVVSAANCPIDPDLGESGLEARGILVVPDFVANAGGILYANIPTSDRTRREILTSLFPRTIARLFRDSEREGRSVTEVARAIAIRRVFPVAHDVARARLELEELDAAFRRYRARFGQRYPGDRPGIALAQRWLETEAAG